MGRHKVHQVWVVFRRTARGMRSAVGQGSLSKGAAEGSGGIARSGPLRFACIFLE